MDGVSGHAQFRVLGPVEVETGGRLVQLDPRLRVVLALLVAGAGGVVSVAALVEGLWGQRPPGDADRTVRAYLSLLRKAMRPATAGVELIVTRPPGYQLRVDPDAVDAAGFERLAAAGRRALGDGQPAVAAEQLAAALRMWRGEAYGEFSDCSALRAEGARLGELRVAALADRVEAELALGGRDELVAELEGLIGTHPGHERLWGQLMTALYRAGRQTDALATYRRAREVLLEESGVEPTPTLAEIHQRILAQDPGLLAAPAARVGRAPVVAPAQLPRPVAGFTGRTRELADLDALLAGAGEPHTPATVVISAVSGTAGVGKTALAVHWAHRVADRFPDGQLYVNLRGFHPAGQAMDPAEAVRGFLDALGTPTERIPASLDAQAALYRSTLAGKRVLVVLDNARDAEHARPLLPGTPTVMVVVTSRSQLTGLVAEGAHPITLDLLTTAEARGLLARRLGIDRVTAEPDAVDGIITACARLPLALTVAAARAATHPDFPLAAGAAELSAARGLLDTLAADDPATDVRAVFSWSYQALTAPAARLFRLLGLHPGPDTSAPAAASLAGQPLPDVRSMLAELARANLITEYAPGRYGFHDLLRAYAADLSHDIDTDQQRRVAVGRLLDHYVHTAYAADRLLCPARDPFPVPFAPPAPGTGPESLAGLQPALAWLTSEHQVLLAALRLAAAAGYDVPACQLTWACATFLDRQGHWLDLTAAWQAVLPAADHLDDPAVQAYVHRSLAHQHMRRGRYLDAQTHSGRALDLYVRAGDLVGQARVHHNLTYLWERRNRPDLILCHSEQALRLFRAADHRIGQANALNNVGHSHALLRNFDQAISHCSQALALLQRNGDSDGEADTWDSLGYIHHQLGDYRQAAECYRHALALFRDLGDRYEEAVTLRKLGNTHDAAGDPNAARTTRQHALDILTAIDHPDAEALRVSLHTHNRPAALTTARHTIAAATAVPGRPAPGDQVTR